MAGSSLGFIGQSIKPREARRLLKGGGTYVSDIHLPHMAHAAVLRSIHAHARIRAIDSSQALQVDGVLLILTGEDVRDRISPFPASFEIHPTPWLEAVQPVFREARPPVLAQGKVHYVGEPVAIVVAEDRYSAEDAVGAMIVDYEELPVVVDPKEALQPGTTLVHDELGQILTGTFVNYLVPSTMEIPNMRIVHRESPSPLNPLGVKGVGEGGAIAPPSAIANALVNALAPFGVEVNELPLKPDRVLKLLRQGTNHTTVE
ncbi:MAG: hypothetical protein V3W08_13025 [Candidatus Binatia bacterium]